MNFLLETPSLSNKSSGAEKVGFEKEKGNDADDEANAHARRKRTSTLPMMEPHSSLTQLREKGKGAGKGLHGAIAGGRTPAHARESGPGTAVCPIGRPKGNLGRMWGLEKMVFLLSRRKEK